MTTIKQPIKIEHFAANLNKRIEFEIIEGDKPVIATGTLVGVYAGVSDDTLIVRYDNGNEQELSIDENTPRLMHPYLQNESASEIINKAAFHCYVDSDDEYCLKITLNDAITAMQQYASQNAKPFNPMKIYRTPTPEEINEAAENHVKALDSYMSDYPTTDHIAHSTWIKAVSWLQNYQTQQQGAVRSAEEILTESKERNKVFGNAGDTASIQAMHEFHNQFQTPASGGSESPKYRVGRKNGSVILSMDGKHEVGRIHDKDLAIDVCEFLNGQSSQPQQNEISETSDIGKIAREFVKLHPEMDSWDSFLSGAISQLNIDISVIEERIKELEQKLNEEHSKKFDDTLSFMAKVSENCRLIYAFAITDYESILTKLKNER